VTGTRFTRVEKLINLSLSRDGNTMHALSAMSGKTLSLEFRKTPFAMIIQPGKEGVRISGNSGTGPDVKIRGTIPDMVAYLMASKLNHDGFSGSLEIIGDIGLAQRFQSIMRNHDLDWEELLSHYTGDLFAHKAGNLIRDTMALARNTRQTMQANVSEYLRYEKEVLADQYEVDAYACSVADLCTDTERLKNRIDRLVQTRITDH